MSLIKNNRSLPVYKEPGGFKYPWAIEYYEKHDALVWHKSEIPLGQDVVDFAKGDDREKAFITNVMKLFTQNDVQAGVGYDTMLRIFQPTEVKLMLRSFADREGTHIYNYANFTDTIGLPASVYTDFLDVPVMATKCEYLDKAKVKKYEDLKSAGLTDAELDREYRRSVARMLAVYAGGLEGTELMAQFAMLLMYQDQGKYPGLCTIVEWSIRDEMTHLQGNAALFRSFIAENTDIWDDSLKFDIYQAMREVVSYEHMLIDYLDPPHADKDVFKRYIEFMADNALKELGMKANWGITKNPIPFMDDVTGITLTDFFAGTVTEYSKELQGSWEELR